ncbi:MAG TPA: cobalamin-dependent protein [bacterium]|nr:cobalamin-dependent protein [bacterium]
MRILFVCRGSEQFGIGILSALARKEGHTVGLLFDPGIDDLFFVPSGAPGRWLEEQLQQRMLTAAVAFRPDLVAGSCFSNSFPYLSRLLIRLRSVLPAYFLLGGIHASLAPAHVLASCPALDAVAVGESEQVFPEFLRRLAAKQDVHTLPGFCFRAGTGVFENPPAPPVTSLDLLPLPDKSLFHNSGVFRATLAFCTSRGCPYHCSFCQIPMLIRTFGIGCICRLLFVIVVV